MGKAWFSAYRLLILLFCTLFLAGVKLVRLPTARSFFESEEKEGTRCAILRAASSGFGNCFHQGFDPANVDENIPPNYIFGDIDSSDPDLFYLWTQYEMSDDNPKLKIETLKEIKETLEHRLHLASSINLIGNIIFGSANGPSILGSVRPSRRQFFDVWDCFKSMTRIYETHCGFPAYYKLKYMEAFANICHRNVAKEVMERACVSACQGYNFTKWSPLILGYTF